MHIRSPAFRSHSNIPQRYTCEGADLSPPLSIDARDAGAKSVAILMQDPDAPRGPFVHWVVYNVPPSVTELAEGLDPSSLPSGAALGTNSFERTGWAGPCPRAGAHTHHYRFTLYALDAVLPDLGPATKQELLDAMKGHILGTSELVGLYAIEEPGREARS